ncbi:hypothetical protein DPMN_111857 [Dreissena polymorpha]|uniref:Uncharacterized protein n=1 Tax=Dreissena polymorpha TaxID=45954 RepID=A0A9D4KEN5_DREPO|nr:hypothetical protein DPMN_111857 [Dreissena polymorpha]
MVSGEAPPGEVPPGELLPYFKGGGELPSHQICRGGELPPHNNPRGLFYPALGLERNRVEIEKILDDQRMVIARRAPDIGFIVRVS